MQHVAPMFSILFSVGILMAALLNTATERDLRTKQYVTATVQIAILEAKVLLLEVQKNKEF